MLILGTVYIVYRCYNDHHGICETFKGFNERPGRVFEGGKSGRSSGLRKLLIEAIEEWKKRRALEKLAGGEVSFSKAAEMAGMDVWSFAALVKESGISWAKEGIREDLEAL